ncbi:MAG TPA: hypothetical protein VK466_04300 [Terriglobales bacterium]|nr:hypothetical protein [Terriglobales bacterium]
MLLATPIPAIVAAYPFGTLCALVGLVMVLAYYQRLARRHREGLLFVDRDVEYPLTDSRFWTARRHLLGGISLSLFWLLLSAMADIRSREPWEWAFLIFAAFAGPGTFVTLLLGCIFLWHHWQDTLADFREPRDAFHQLQQPVDTSERSELSRMRVPLLKESMWGICALSLAVWVSKLLGIVRERLLENSLVASIYDEIVWIFILTFLVVLWTTRNRFVLVLRTGVLLLFTLIVLSGLAGFLWWLVSELSPSLVLFSAAIVVVNFVYFYRLERSSSMRAVAAHEVSQA